MKNAMDYIVLLCILMFYGHSFYAITVGSNSLVSRQNFVSFLSTDTNNTIEGFVLLDEGFGLQNSATTLVYNGAFPVVQNMYLNGGTLTLSRDLSLESSVTFTSLGTINGNNHVVRLPPTLQSIGYFDTLPGCFNDLTLSINASLIVDTALTFTGTSELDCNNNHLTLTPYGSLIAGDGAVLTIKNAIIDQVAGTNIRCNGDTSEIVLQNVELIMDEICTFSTGKLTFRDEVTFAGTGTFVYDSTQTSTITSASKLHITDSVTLNMGKNATSESQPFYFEDSTSTLLLDNCYLYVRDTGTILTRGMLMLDRQTVIDMAATSSANGLILGDGIDSANDVIIYYSPSAVSYFDSGWLTNNNVNPDTFVSASNTARIIRDIGASMYIARNWNLIDITSKVTSYAVTPLLFGPSATLDFNNVDIEFPDSMFNVNGSMTSSAAFRLTGNKTISLSKGSFLSAIIVSNGQNYIVGNGKINGPIILTDAASHVTWDAIGLIQSTPTLNGGTFALTKNLELGSDIVINGPGTLNVGGNVVTVKSGNAASWTTPLTWVGAGGGITLESDMSLSNVWTCSGSVVFDGAGHALDLESAGEIVVDAGSKLKLVHMKLKNALDSRIRCLADNSIIELEDVDWILDDVYTFTKGSINYTGTVSYIGTGTLLYDSESTSTITANSQLNLTRGVTLNVGKNLLSGNQPFYMEDSSAYMIMDNCYLYVRFPGYTVSRGTLFLKKDITIDVASTSTATGFILGAGTSSDNDVTIYYSPSAITTFNSGHLVYNNVNPDRFKSSSNTAKIVRNFGAHSYVAHNWNLANITSKLGSRLVSPLGFAPGISLAFDDVIIEFPDAIFNVKGSITNPSAFNLTGDGYIFLDKGSFLAGIIVSGTNNTIVGNGKIAGPIIFTAPTAQLTWGAIGSINANPTLNYGTLILGKNLDLGPAVSLTGPGTINVGAYNFSVNLNDAAWTTPLTIIGAQGGVKLNSNMELSHVWTCSGTVKIDGQNNYLNLGLFGSLSVASGSTLILKNITLKGVAGDNISCQDDTAEIIFQDTVIESVGDFTYAQGGLQFFDKNKYRGVFSFIYSSTQSCTIAPYSTLLFASGSTFDYAPTDSSRNLLVFTDNTAQLLLNNATFKAETGGIDLTKGSLAIAGTCALSSTVNGGIAFGDELVENDFSCLIANGSQLSITAGALWYKNINAASLIMQNNLSSLYFASNTVLKVYQNIDLGPAKAVFADNSQLIIQNGASISGSLIPQGYLFRDTF